MGEDFCGNCGKKITGFDVDKQGLICLRCCSRKILYVA